MFLEHIYARRGHGRGRLVDDGRALLPTHAIVNDDSILFVVTGHGLGLPSGTANPRNSLA
jgi:hypothetical protein